MKAKLESGLPDFSFKRLVPGAFNVDLIGSACTVLAWEDVKMLQSNNAWQGGAVEPMKPMLNAPRIMCLHV